MGLIIALVLAVNADRSVGCRANAEMTLSDE